jgi:hypothetical protein
MLRMCVYMHSRFVENHPIRILEDGPLISKGVLSHRCILCLRTGHRVHHCHFPIISHRHPSAPELSTQEIVKPAPNLRTPAPSMATHRFVLEDHPSPGSLLARADRVDASTAFTPEMLATENDYHSRGLIAVAIYDDPWYCVTLDAVREATTRWLDIHPRDVHVDFYPPKGFLLLLPSSEIRDHALSSNAGITAGRAKLQLIPWTRMARADVCKLQFKVHLCIQGIPPHARQASAAPPPQQRQLLLHHCLVQGS